MDASVSVRTAETAEMDEKQEQHRSLTSLPLRRDCEQIIWATNTTPCPFNICFAQFHAELDPRKGSDEVRSDVS